MKIKLDLHIHSKYSHDSNNNVDAVVRKAKKIGLDGIAITDHEEFEGAKIATEKYKNFIIINGEEIDTEYGDIIGLFLNKKIKTKKFNEVVSEIKKQDGIVVLPHPARFHILTDDVLKKVDVIEVFNARVGRKENIMAKRLADKFNKKVIAGSDAHFIFEIGNGVTILDVKDRSLNGIKAAILNGNIKLQTKRSGKFFRGIALAKKIIKSLNR